MSAHMIRENEQVFWTHPRLKRRFAAEVIMVSCCGRYAKILLKEAVGKGADENIGDALLDAIEEEEGQEWAVGVKELRHKM